MRCAAAAAVAVRCCCRWWLCADSYNFCIVPNSSYDVTLFGGLAVVLACLLQGKLNTLMVLVAGAAAVVVYFVGILMSGSSTAAAAAAAATAATAAAHVQGKFNNPWSWWQVQQL
jgi:hypothetical protein